MIVCCAVTDLGTATAERMVHLNYVRAEICAAVNKELNYSFSTIPAADATPTFGDGEAAFMGKTAGCHAATNNQIWFVLLDL